MYVESVPNRGSPPAILLRESYRDGDKIKKRTLLNLSELCASSSAKMGLVMLGRGRRGAPV